MDLTILHGNNYSRQINTDLFQSASPIFQNVGQLVDVSTSGLPNKILDYVFDLIEGINLDQTLNYDEYIKLNEALNTFQMNKYIPIILKNFRQIIFNFNNHQFASIVYILLDNNIDPQLTANDLIFFPVENPFAQFIIDQSKQTYLNYSYFSTAGEISRYSSLMPWHLNGVRNVLLKEIPNVNKITDLTAHIGVDSVNFSVIYPNAKVLSIEFDYDTYLLLRDNLLRYSIILNRSPLNLRAYNNDATKILNHPMIIDSDVVYIDPPWGGSDYNQRNNVRLKLGDMAIEEIIRQLIRNGIKTIILKGPANLYTQELYNLGLKIKRYEIYTKAKGGKLSYLLFFIRI
jgi:hypothetical protein